MKSNSVVVRVATWDWDWDWDAQIIYFVNYHKNCIHSKHCQGWDGCEVVLTIQPVG